MRAEDGARTRRVGVGASASAAVADSAPPARTNPLFMDKLPEARRAPSCRSASPRHSSESRSKGRGLRPRGAKRRAGGAASLPGPGICPKSARATARPEGARRAAGRKAAPPTGAFVRKPHHKRRRPEPARCAAVRKAPRPSRGICPKGAGATARPEPARCAAVRKAPRPGRGICPKAASQATPPGTRSTPGRPQGAAPRPGHSVPLVRNASRGSPKLRGTPGPPCVAPAPEPSCLSVSRGRAAEPGWNARGYGRGIRPKPASPIGDDAAQPRLARTGAQARPPARRLRGTARTVHFAPPGPPRRRLPSTPPRRIVPRKLGECRCSTAPTPPRAPPPPTP